MSIKEMRDQTGLSQSKFAGMFDIPMATLKDWEQCRRNPPFYVHAGAPQCCPARLPASG